MRYLNFTYVDAVTRRPVSETAARNGPVMPTIAGLQFGFALESLYPTAVPSLYGTCDDNAELDVPGVLGELTLEQYEAAFEAEMTVRLEKARAAAIAANNVAYESAIALMTVDYPASEIATWERQRAEALAWEADPATPTPWIDLAASARGLDRVQYLTRTLAKVRAFSSASAWLTGRRQGIDDAIHAAITVESVHAISIDYALPEEVL